MTKKAENIYSEWLNKALEDESSAQALLENEAGSPATVCFLCHQLAEKHLKALLIYHGKEFPKAHDLLGLETLLLEVEAGIKKIHQMLGTLNRYYIETRYPGDFPEFTWDEAREAFQAAQEVKDFVLKQIEKL